MATKPPSPQQAIHSVDLPGPFTRLLLWSACVEPRLTPGLPYVATRFRYGVIGALVITSAGFALFSCLSFLTYFDIGASLPRAAIFGLSFFWAFLIFNLERLILISRGEGGNRFSAASTLILRVFIAVVLGLLLSEPLKLRMFRGDIEKIAQEQLPVKRAEYNQRITRQQAQDPRSAEITQLSGIRNYFESLRDCEANNAANQAAGTSNYVRCVEAFTIPPGVGPQDQPPKNLFSDQEQRDAIRKNSATAIDGKIAKRSRDLARFWQGRVDSFDTAQHQGGRLADLRRQTQDEAANNRAAFEASLTSMTPLESYKYMAQLARSDSGANFLSWLVTIGFVLIDLIVLVAKLSFKTSIYEKRVASLEGVIETIETSFKSLTSEVVGTKFQSSNGGRPPSVEKLVDDALDDYTAAVGSAYRSPRYQKLKVIATSAAATAAVITWPAVFIYLEKLAHLLHAWLSNIKIFKDIFLFFGI